MTDLDTLARLAGEATKGPWAIWYDDYERGTWCIGPSAEAAGDVASDVPTADAAYIAAMHPGVGAALVEVARAAKVADWSRHGAVLENGARCACAAHEYLNTALDRLAEVS